MKRGTLLLILGLLLLATGAWAASAGPYDLLWYSVDGGGATLLTGGAYALGGTAGQADAGVLAGGDYTLAGGFWAGGVVAPPPEYGLYLPLVVRGG